LERFMVDVVSRSPSDSYVEWGAIFAGAVAASAISFVLLTAGSGIGLSLVSVHEHKSYGKAAASIAAFWMIAVPIISFLIGGYIAGRMRAPRGDALHDEVEFRDGIHGLLVWATSVVIGGVLAFLVATGAAQVGGEAVKTAASNPSAVATAADALARPGPAPSTAVKPENAEQNNAAGRTLTAAVGKGELTAEDRAYLAQFVSQRTGMPQPEAEKRVDEVFAKAKEAAETVRKATVAAALVTATALLIGLAAAWYAAQRGGHHRDNNIPARFTFSPSRRVGLED
jgi:hypothetical protein